MEYKSKSTIYGVPVFHINSGSVVDGIYKRGIANGWIAIGDMAIGRVIGIGGIAFGVVAIGGVGIGIVGLGGVGAGILGVGGLGLGILCGCGGIAIGGICAFGSIAISLFKSAGAISISLKGIEIVGGK